MSCELFVRVFVTLSLSCCVCREGKEKAAKCTNVSLWFLLDASRVALRHSLVVSEMKPWPWVQPTGSILAASQDALNKARGPAFTEHSARNCVEDQTQLCNEPTVFWTYSWTHPV